MNKKEMIYMGYYTYFTLEIHASINTANKIHEYLDTYEDDYYFIHSEDRTKGYDHEKYMIQLSNKFPDVLLELYGEGEEAGDVWYKYFKNGRIQRCPAQITFEPFDESKLEELEKNDG
jgi:hypothetical protein